MFYKQFLSTTNVFNQDFIDEFDFWLATLPDNKVKNITPSAVSSRFTVAYSFAKKILDLSCELGIMQQYFIIKCPNEECNLILDSIKIEEISKVLSEKKYCHNCDLYYTVFPDDIYLAYKIIERPNISEKEYEKELEKHIKLKENFNIADSLAINKTELYKAFYNPDELAYSNLLNLRNKLDNDYGRNTTAKGDSFEVLVLELFQLIKCATATNQIKTSTNQFDCTVKFTCSSYYLSLFNYLSPYFLIECKNEKGTPSNTYFHKLSSIMDTNEAKIGIVFSRKSASREIKQIAYNTYLTHMGTEKDRILLSMSEEDLDKIINERINLLEYIDYKIMDLTANFKNGNFEMFKLKNEDNI